MDFLGTLVTLLLVVLLAFPVVAYPQMAILTFLYDAVAWLWGRLRGAPPARFTDEPWLSYPGAVFLLAAVAFYALALAVLPSY